MAIQPFRMSDTCKRYAVSLHQAAADGTLHLPCVSLQAAPNKPDPWLLLCGSVSLQSCACLAARRDYISCVYQHTTLLSSSCEQHGPDFQLRSEAVPRCELLLQCQALTCSCCTNIVVSYSLSYMLEVTCLHTRLDCSRSQYISHGLLYSWQCKVCQVAHDKL